MIIMTRQPFTFIKSEVLPWNRLLEVSDRTSSPIRNDSIHSIPTSGVQGCGEALGARYALDAAMRATGGQLMQ